MKKILSIVLCLTMLVSFVACSNSNDTPATSSGSSTSGGGDASTSTGSSPAATDGNFKDTLIFAPNTDIQDIDPQVQNDTTSEQVVRMVFNGLLKFDDEKGGEIVGDLAESWEASEDGLTWTFKLKPGVKFHGGQDLTSADVVATFERRNAAEAGALRSMEIMKPIVKVEAIDDLTVAITTAEPYGPMEALMCNLTTAIMCKETIETYSLEDLDSKAEAVNGTGPYKFAAWKKGEEVTLERFDDYFEGPSPTKTIIYRPIAEASARVIALESGEVDVIAGINADDLPALESNPNLAVIKSAGVGARCFRFGCNDEIMSNTKVRQAIVHAIDRQVIIDSLFNGVAYPSTFPLTPVVFGYDNIGEIKQDQEKARQLLAEAGYPDGFETKIVTTERYAKGVQLAEVIASQLAEVGIKAEIDVWEWSALSASWNGITADEFDQPIFIMGTGPSMRDADGGFRGLYTTSETGLNDRNYGFYHNERVDELVMAGMKETDPAKRKELYAEAGQILYLDDPAAFWLFDQYILAGHSTKVENVKVNGLGLITFEKATVKA